MDAHELYVKYTSTTLTDDIHISNDANTLQLARLMGVIQTECDTLEDTTLGIGKLSLDADEEEITNIDTITNTDTVPNTPTTVSTATSVEKKCERHYIHICDTMMVQHSVPRIGALARAVGAVVDIKWVHSFASQVKCSGDIPSETIYETLRPESDRHVHIVNNNVMAFVAALHDIQTNKITTFAWSHDSNHAIHLQKMDIALRKQFRNVKSVLSATILASIGLPMHELFKIKEYFLNTRKWRFKNMTSDSLIKTTLRPKVTIHKIDEKLETNQLLKEYNKTETIFDVQDHPKTVEMFMFKHWYSYPTGQEMKTIVERAIFNLNKWTGTLDFSNVVKRRRRRKK